MKHGDIKSVDSVCPTKNQHSEIQATPLLDTDVRLETQLIILASSICPRFTNANLRDVWVFFVGRHVRKYTVQSERCNHGVLVTYHLVYPMISILWFVWGTLIVLGTNPLLYQMSLASLDNHWQSWIPCKKNIAGYPLVNIQKAIDNGHRNSEFSH